MELKGLSIPFLRAKKIFPNVLSRSEIAVQSVPHVLCQFKKVLSFAEKVERNEKESRIVRPSFY